MAIRALGAVGTFTGIAVIAMAAGVHWLVANTVAALPVAATVIAVWAQNRKT